MRTVKEVDEAIRQHIEVLVNDGEPAITATVSSAITVDSAEARGVVKALRWVKYVKPKQINEKKDKSLQDDFNIPNPVRGGKDANADSAHKS